ncbi:MAG: hydroxyisourate hydrolase [Chitinophagaceae bacterium]
MSQLTTHILDTSTGKPASGVEIILYKLQDGTWQSIAKGSTNNDGRIPNLLDDETKLMGIYKMRFETKSYFTNNKIVSFYPFIEISFNIDSTEHYHIPLLLNPFGYTTYRGS